jgi:hypothetical protein
MFDMNAALFIRKCIKFYSLDPDILSTFHGYKYKPVRNDELIQEYLRLINDVIASSDPISYEYVLNWIAYIVQHPGIKTRTALILKGLQRIGKNRFTDVVCEMLSGYSEANVTDISEMTGNFNSVVENKMIIIMNEVGNAKDNNSARGTYGIANWDSMKSIITDTTIRINEKNEPRRTSENVANLIFVTNNPHPVNIEQSDNRYAVFACNALHRGDHDYFNRLSSGFTEEFYKALTWFFMNKDISGYNPEVILMNDARREMIEASRSIIDIFCCNHYDELRTE